MQASAMDSFKIIKLLEQALVLLTQVQVKISTREKYKSQSHINCFLFNQGGFGIGLGVGAGVATPIGNFAVGDGQSKLKSFYKIRLFIY